MTGGDAYVLDRDRRLDDRLAGSVHAGEPDAGQLEALRELLERHLRHTESRRAAELLDHWHEEAASFRRIAPAAEASAPELSDDVAAGIAP
jgi:glutamate synthase (NADPH/NADH) large chain